MAASKTKSKSGNKSFVCDLCGKAFAMPAHLGRHKTAMHNIPSKASAKKKGRKKHAAKSPTTGRKPGRPPAIATRYKLADMPLDELASLIKAAKDEAARRIREYQDLLS